MCSHANVDLCNGLVFDRAYVLHISSVSLSIYYDLMGYCDKF